MWYRGTTVSVEDDCDVQDPLPSCRKGCVEIMLTIDGKWHE